jgi:adenylate cyclase
MIGRDFLPAMLKMLLLAAAALAGSLLLTQGGIGEKIETGLSDLRLRHVARAGLDNAVVVIAIDERALETIGPWPWPRSRLGQFIERLGSRYQPAGIVLDMVLPPGPPMAEEAALAAVLGRPGFPPVIAGQLLLHNDRHKGIYRPASIAGAPPGKGPYSGYLGISPELAGAVAAIGHINAEIDPDGRIRRTASLLCREDGCSLNQGLAYMSHMLGDPPWRLQRGGFWQPAWRLFPEGAPSLTVPLREDLTVALPWRETSPHLYISAAEVWEGQLDRELLKDRVVLIGGHAMGLGDSIQSPFGRVFGVEAHARFLSALLAGSFTYVPRYAWLAVALVVVAQGLLILAFRKRRWVYGAIGLGLAVSWLAGNAAAYGAGWELPISMPLTFPLLLVLVLLLADLGASRSMLLRGLKSYLPAPLVARLAQGEEPEQQVAWTTVLYADIVGYSVATAGMAPERAAEWCNAGVDLVIAEIESRGGHIDNVAGDGLLVYWREGGPEQQAERAIDAAASICLRLPALNEEIHARGLPQLQIGIGLHAGPLIAGSYGGVKRRYTVLGDVANTAHRIERLTRQLPHRFLLSSVVAAAQKRYATHSVGEYHLINGEPGVELHRVDVPMPAG